LQWRGRQGRGCSGKDIFNIAIYFNDIQKRSVDTIDEFVASLLHESA
jgi:hypothetical protein